MNHKMDPGGPTNKGVTQATYDGYRRKHSLPLQSVRCILVDEVNEIYFRYWDEAECDKMPYPVALVHFDTAINFGIWGAGKLLQRTLGVDRDGIVGPKTLTAVHSLDKFDLAREYCNVRIAKRWGRVKESPKAIVFLAGWLNRDYGLRKEVQALTLLNGRRM